MLTHWLFKPLKILTVCETLQDTLPRNTVSYPHFLLNDPLSHPPVQQWAVMLHHCVLGNMGLEPITRDVSSSTIYKTLHFFYSLLNQQNLWVGTYLILVFDNTVVLDVSCPLFSLAAGVRGVHSWRKNLRSEVSQTISKLSSVKSYKLLVAKRGLSWHPSCRCMVACHTVPCFSCGTEAALEALHFPQLQKKQTTCLELHKVNQHWAPEKLLWLLVTVVLLSLPVASEDPA